MILSIYTDGGARGNPGPAGIGVVVKKEDNTVFHSFGKTIGKATNNVAEYTAVIEALTWLKSNASNISNSSNKISFFLDSTLVVNQLNGLFKIKEPTLRTLLFQVRQLEQDIGGNVSYTYVPREKNWEADALVNQALDNS